MINEKSDKIIIPGHIGTWYVFDSKFYPEFDGTLFLVESEQYGDEAAWLIIDEYGEIILDDVYDGWFDLDEVLYKI